MNTEFKYKEVEEVYNIANANLLTLYHIIDNMAETIKSYFTTFKVQYDSNTYKFIINTDTFMFVIVQNMDNITLDIVLNGDAIVQDVAYANGKFIESRTRMANNIATLINPICQALSYCNSPEQLTKTDEE